LALAQALLSDFGLVHILQMKQYCIFFEKDGMRWVDYVMVCDCPCVPVCAESFEDRCHFLKRALLKVYRRKYRNVKLAFYFKKKKPHY
jgi:hypothetical protein